MSSLRILGHNDRDIILQTLPTEIIIEIVKAVQAEEQRTKYSKEFPRGWVKLMHVCSHFRYAIVANAELWRVIEIGVESGPEAAMYFLERSAPLPISVTHYYDEMTTPAPSTVFSPFYYHLIEERSRIQSLTFGGELMDGQWELLKQRLPSLQSLSFVNPTKYCVPNTMPRLISKHPTVSSFQMGFYTPDDLSGMRGLTELILVEGSAGADGTQLLHVLGQISSHLVTLKMFGGIPREDFPQDTDGVVDLPCLRLLTVAPGRIWRRLNRTPSLLFQFLSIPMEAEVLWDFHDGTFTEWPQTPSVKQVVPYAGTELLWLKGSTLYYPSTSFYDSPRYMDSIKSKILERTPLIEELVYGIRFAARLGAGSWLRSLANETRLPHFRMISILLHESQPSLLAWAQQFVDHLDNKPITVRLCPNKSQRCLGIEGYCTTEEMYVDEDEDEDEDDGYDSRGYETPEDEDTENEDEGGYQSELD